MFASTFLSVSYRKNCCGHKLKEMTGSDIFSDNGNVTNNAYPNHTSRIHYHHDQVTSYLYSSHGGFIHSEMVGLLFFLQDSQISFSGGEDNAAVTTPKKPTTSSAKLKELGRSVQTQADSKSKKKQSKATIFASPSPPAIKQQVKGNNNMEESAKASNVKN